MKILTIPKALRDKLGEDGSDSLVELLNESGDTQKEDILLFNKVGLAREFDKVHETIASSKSDIIKWMFIFWLGQVTVILGILFVFFKKP